MKDNETKLPPLIAIIGCDGSGKSTVSDLLLEFVTQYGPVKTTPLGKQQGNIGRSLASLPLIGNWLEGFISKKVKKVNKNKQEKKTPELLPSLVIYLFTLRRLRRFKRMLSLRKKGFIIVTDRYPQLDVPQGYDVPDLQVDLEGNFVVRWLAKKELKAFEWMTSYVPDLVIRLNVDIDTACQRKPDHKRELLLRKIDVTPKLKFNGAKIIEIDSSEPLEKVLATAKEAIIPLLTEHGYQLNET